MGSKVNVGFVNNEYNGFYTDTVNGVCVHCKADIVKRLPGNHGVKDYLGAPDSLDLETGDKCDTCGTVNYTGRFRVMNIFDN